MSLLSIVWKADREIFVINVTLFLKHTAFLKVIIMNDHFGRGRPASLVVSPIFYRTLVRNLKVSYFKLVLSYPWKCAPCILNFTFWKVGKNVGWLSSYDKIRDPPLFRLFFFRVQWISCIDCNQNLVKCYFKRSSNCDQYVIKTRMGYLNAASLLGIHSENKLWLLFQRYRIPFNVIHEDLGPEIQKVSINRPEDLSFQNFNFGVYHTLPEVSFCSKEIYFYFEGKIQLL